MDTIAGDNDEMVILKETDEFEVPNWMRMTDESEGPKFNNLGNISIWAEALPQPVRTAVKLFCKKIFGTLHTTQTNVTFTILVASNTKFETEERAEMLSW